ADGQRNRGQEGLVHRAIDLVVVVGAGGSRHQHTHAGKERADEDDDDEENLPAHADGGVAGVADVVADEGVVDDPLQATDGVLKPGRPGDLPDGRCYRTVHDRAIELTLLD